MLAPDVDEVRVPVARRVVGASPSGMRAAFMRSSNRAVHLSVNTARLVPSFPTRLIGTAAPRARLKVRRFTLAAAVTAPVPFAIPVLDVDQALARLPAEARARVVWAKKPIENGLARLCTEQLTDDLVAQVADETWKPLASIGRVFRSMVAASPDEWRARLVDDFKLEEERFAAFVEQEDSRDTLRWILGLLQSFVGLALSVPAEVVGEIDDGLLDQLGADADFRLYLRGSLALMGANETRRTGGDPQRARDLLDVAFLELNRFRATMRKHGVFLTPFPFETVEERRRGLLESAHRLRDALSEDDWRVLEQARMHDLR